MADLIDVFGRLGLLIIGLLAGGIGVPVFLTGFRQRANLTVIAGCVFIFVSLFCIITFCFGFHESD